MAIMMFAIFILSIFIPSVNLNQDVMKSLSYKFGTKLFECGERTNYTRAMARDILHIWEESYDLNHDETGCLVLCAMVRLELLDQQGNMIVENTEGFIRANGGDDSMVSFLIQLYSMCRDKTSSISNGCKAAIELSKCFRAAIQQIGWVPDTTSLLVISYD
ncbi:pheromone-binding protein-like [Danaus plexippus]|uniref:pheromone-binding protein-like n=1 Tax=Danaus plexippus TaxID=13037 RepID=UPI002AAF4CC3|nr:pheromone-binding protein-like [Danaus plexippus]